MTFISTKFYFSAIKIYIVIITQYVGKNIYGIVRAPRAASTEAIVVSVPYRSMTSVHADTTPSIALLLAFAQFCRREYNIKCTFSLLHDKLN